MKKFHKLKVIGVLLCFLLTSSISFAQTGAPPDNEHGPRACLNIFVPGLIINSLEALLTAPANLPPLQNIGAIVRVLAEASEPNIISVLHGSFDMGVNDNRGDVCFFFDFEGFAEGNPDASRVIRLEQVDVNALFEAGETECQLAASEIPNASFTLDVYNDSGADNAALDEDDIISDFRDEEAPILMVTNIPDAPPFEINLFFCDESPTDDPATEADESLESTGFKDVPSLEEYCDAASEVIAESENPDEEPPAICGEMIRFPQNRQIFVITDTDGYFNYSVDR